MYANPRTDEKSAMVQRQNNSDTYSSLTTDSDLLPEASELRTQSPIYEQPVVQALPPHWSTTYQSDRRYWNDFRLKACIQDEFFCVAGKKFKKEFQELTGLNPWEMAVKEPGATFYGEGGFIPFYAVFAERVVITPELDARGHEVMERVAREEGITSRPIRYMVWDYPPDDFSDEDY